VHRRIDHAIGNKSTENSKSEEKNENHILKIDRRNSIGTIGAGGRAANFGCRRAANFGFGKKGQRP
jgi:hypothetical protein